MSEFSENEREELQESSSESKEDTVELLQDADFDGGETQSSERTVYRWNYDEQVAHDEATRKRAHRRGVILYVAVLSSVLLLCMALLIGVILWANFDGADWGSHDLSDIGKVAQSVSPSTVLIESSSRYGTGYGTGFFLTGDGYIATNYHVIEGADTVTVTLYGGESYTASVVGYYAIDDLAVLKIDGIGFSALPIGNSDAALVGDTVVVVGNPSGRDASWTTTHGIVSATGRRVLVSDGERTGSLKMIQTDAPVNPGNSGGALCNLRGEVIGIITQKLSGYEGIGFAIPINEAMHTLQAIINGEVDTFTSTASKLRPSIGITVENISEGENYHIEEETYTAPCDGLLIASVTEGSGAEGVLLYGDLLYEFDGKPAQNTQVLQDLLFHKKIGDRVKVKVYRGKNSLELTVTLS